MGEVYEPATANSGAVAIKVLPAAFVNDAERVARFQREARLLASLNHPNIAIIHGLEEFQRSALSGNGIGAWQDARRAHR